jgi:hypothetical protein
MSHLGLGLLRLVRSLAGYSGITVGWHATLTQRSTSSKIARHCSPSPIPPPRTAIHPGSVSVSDSHARKSNSDSVSGACAQAARPWEGLRGRDCSAGTTGCQASGARAAVHRGRRRCTDFDRRISSGGGGGRRGRRDGGRLLEVQRLCNPAGGGGGGGRVSSDKEPQRPSRDVESHRHGAHRDPVTAFTKVDPRHVS